MDPGARLKEVRSKLGITTREFAAFSKAIADAEGNEEFLISSGWLTQIENEEDALPSIYKLFTLASVYGLSYGDVLALYGVDAKKVKKYHAELPIAKTRLAQYDSAEAPESLEVPVRFDAGVNLSQTNLLWHMIESWGRVPLEFIQQVFQTMRDCPQHTFQILTKRSDRLRQLAAQFDWPPNVWMGVSVEDARALSRVDDLRVVRDDLNVDRVGDGLAEGVGGRPLLTISWRSRA